MTELEKLKALIDQNSRGPLVRWTCQRCKMECHRVDNGKGRQQVSCVCGQSVILLNMKYPDWID